jgi:hypothetical protein
MTLMEINSGGNENSQIVILMTIPLLSKTQIACVVELSLWTCFLEASI